jgi:signal peptidase I
MQAFKRFSSGILSAISIVIMIAVWIAFAPVQAGGRASYIIVIGNSMEPNFHIGDLVIVHKELDYQVGAAVVYRNRDLNSFVFHRIISKTHQGYTLQGDNNTWVDTYQPAKEEILGKLWLAIPRGGTALKKMRSPIGMASIAAVLGAFLAGSLLQGQARGTKYMKHKSVRDWLINIQKKTQHLFQQGTHSDNRKQTFIDLAGSMEAVFFFLGSMLLVALLAALVSFSRPSARTIEKEIQYQHFGIFNYSALAPQGIYDQNRIKSGDPIFSSLTCAVDLNFQYTLIAPEANNIQGTYQLTATIREQSSGWERTLALQEAISYTGSAFSASGILDLCKIETLIRSMEMETDFHPGSYVLLVSPNIKMTGDIQGQALDSTFNPSLTFMYDHTHFYLLQGQDDKNPLVVGETGKLSTEQDTVNVLSFLGRQLKVPIVRWLASIGLLVSLTGLGLLALKLHTLAQTDRAQFIRAQYSSLLVDVQEINAFASLHSIDVTSMDALATLAERSNAVILHRVEDGKHTYYVQTSGVVYRFELESKKSTAEDLQQADFAQEKV